MLRGIGQNNYCTEVSRNDKERYGTIKKSGRLLMTSAGSEVSVGPLTLATFYYTRRYKKVVNICQNICSRWKPYAIYPSVEHGLYYNMYGQYVCGRGLCRFDNASNAFVSDVFIGPAIKKFYPAELYHDIEVRDPYSTYIYHHYHTYYFYYSCVTTN